jgi:hypothetical protein
MGPFWDAQMTPKWPETVYHPLQSQNDTLVLDSVRLSVNQFSKKLCKMESPGKYDENEPNRNLLPPIMSLLGVVVTI